MSTLLSPADHRIKLKECEKRDKYLDLARELKKLWNMKGDNYTNCDWLPFSSVTKGLLKDRGRFGSWRQSERPSQTTALLKTARILRKSPGDLRWLAVTPISSERPSVYADVKNSNEWIIIMKIWTVELTAGRKSLAEVKIQRYIQERCANTFTICNLNSQKIHCVGYKLSKSQEKTNHLMYMDDIKLFTKKHE